MDMGFERQDVISALRLSRNDYELACEYLLNSDSRIEEQQLIRPADVFPN